MKNNLRPPSRSGFCGGLIRWSALTLRTPPTSLQPFRLRLDFYIHWRNKIMTENELTAAAERLETIHKQFANMVMMLIEGFNKMENICRRSPPSRRPRVPPCSS